MSRLQGSKTMIRVLTCNIWCGRIPRIREVRHSFLGAEVQGYESLAEAMACDRDGPKRWHGVRVLSKP
jgi:hypothetical protein